VSKDKLPQCYRADDPINPSYYKDLSIEPIDFVDSLAKHLPSEYVHYVHNIIKYISRFDRKNGVEDIDKALYYLNRLRDKFKER
jgi:hypothetical protein